MEWVDNAKDRRFLDRIPATLHTFIERTLALSQLSKRHRHHSIARMSRSMESRNRRTNRSYANDSQNVHNRQITIATTNDTSASNKQRLADVNERNSKTIRHTAFQ
jgi:hypothetical protein